MPLRALILIACGFAISPAQAQIKTATDDPYLRFGETVVTRYQVGAKITAKRGPVQDLLAMVAIPFTCPEQEVQIVEQDITPQVDMVNYRPVGAFASGGAQQMLITVPHLPGKEEARAIITFDVSTRVILPPENTDSLSIPIKPERDLKRFLGKSPYIDTKHPKIKKALREIEASLADKEPTAWQRVEAIYDYVQEHVKYEQGPDKSAVQTLTDGSGDCQNISALFIALCRTAGVPARIVWVHEHNYAEFCLVDPEGKPHWFPCESSGTRAFGEMPLARVILQKGDNFTVPERRGEHLRYASDYLIGLPVPGSGKPSVTYIRHQM